MLLVLTGVYALFSGQNKTTHNERDALNLQMDLRVAMERVKYVVRHAGFGCEDSFADGDTLIMQDPASGFNSTTSFDTSLVVNNNPANGTSPDSLVVVYGVNSLGDLGNATTAGTQFEITTSHTPKLDPGNLVGWISFLQRPFGDHFHQLSLYDGSGGCTLTSGVSDLQNGTEVFLVSPVRIQVDGNTLQFENFAYNKAKYSSYQSYFDFVDNVQDLQLLYTTDGTSWTDDPANPEEVEGVWICLLGRSAEPLQDYEDTRTYDYFCNATGARYTVGPFNDAFKRKVIEAKVWIRNRND